MKKIVLILGFLMLVLTACPQKLEQTFDELILVKKGIMFADKTVQTTAGTGISDWLTILNKPLTFTPSIHNHDLLYKPINYEPASVPFDLGQEILILGYLPIPERTTVEINALVIPKGVKALVSDKTLNVLKYWDGVKWKIVTMGQ